MYYGLLIENHYTLIIEPSTQIVKPAPIWAIQYMRALELLIFPDARAQAVIAGLKWPPEILPPSPIAVASAATIKRGEEVNETAPIRRHVPRYSTKAGVFIVYNNEIFSC
jgi:hypothetical protein